MPFQVQSLIGIAAGETDNPKEAVPRAIKTTIGRLVIFFVLTIVVLASLLPMKEAGVSSAPFVDVFDKMGIPICGRYHEFCHLDSYPFCWKLWTLCVKSYALVSGQ